MGPTRKSGDRFPSSPAVGGAGQHPVFGRYPALPLALEKRRDLGLDADAAEHVGIPHSDQYRTIGTGLDTIFHTDRAQAAGKAIAISGTATIFGFGSLILGQHWGVKSLGLCLVLGIGTCLILALVIVPVLFERRSSLNSEK